MSKVNRKYKSSVFTHLFRETGKGFELYNAVAPGRFPAGTPVEDVTLSGVMYMDRVNDLSLLVGNKLAVFFEHQSTINRNIPLRDLLYCGRVYERIVSNRELYSEKRMRIPTPEFYVLYNGRKAFPEKAVYRLSDMFVLTPEGEPALELVVEVFNVNEGFNDCMIKRSETLSGYMALVTKARGHESSGMKRPAAVRSAIRECIREGILVEYLEKYGSEVVNMLYQEWDWSVAKSVWDKESAEREREKWRFVVARNRALVKVYAAKMAENAAKLAENAAKLAENAAKLADKDAKLADKDAKLADKDAEIVELKARLNQGTVTQPAAGQPMT